MQSAFQLETNEQEGGALSKVKYESRALRVIRRACVCACLGDLTLHPCLWSSWVLTGWWKRSNQTLTPLPAVIPHSRPALHRHLLVNRYNNLPLRQTTPLSHRLHLACSLKLPTLVPLVPLPSPLCPLSLHAAPCCSITIICVFLQPAHLSFSLLSRSHLRWGQGRGPSCPLYRGIKMATVQQQAQRFNPGTSAFKRAQCQNNACTANKH